MCRNIKRLRQLDHTVTDEEMRDAALQFVRKVTGYRKPSRANAAAFEAAVEEISAATRRLLGALVGPGERFPTEAAARGELAGDRQV
ncbi:MAG TPA: DUF2277 domain-containing protein [Anaerolineales bacterium]|nr:DUF2277 domain-containing protein [Anaerolineales bacterium]